MTILLQPCLSNICSCHLPTSRPFLTVTEAFLYLAQCLFRAHHSSFEILTLQNLLSDYSSYHAFSNSSTPILFKLKPLFVPRLSPLLTSLPSMPSLDSEIHFCGTPLLLDVYPSINQDNHMVFVTDPKPLYISLSF